MEPVPGTSQELPATGAERPAEVPQEEAIAELTAQEKEDEPDEENANEYFKKYMLTSKGKDLEEKIQEACKEINYRNLVVLIVVGDYVVNQAKNIKEVTRKWGLSFSAVPRTMSCREHSVVVDSMPKGKGWQRSRRGPPRKVNVQKKSGQLNQLELKVHNQQNRVKTPQIAGNYQMYLGHEPESQKKKLEDSWKPDPEPPPPPPTSQ